MVVRNVIEGTGVEFMYDLYSPTVKEVEVLRLEKRLDDELYYLRDADLKHSTVPIDMMAEILPPGQPVPVNDLVVPLKPWPWTKRWERYADRLFGYSFKQDELPYKRQLAVKHWTSELSYVS